MRRRKGAGDGRHAADWAPPRTRRRPPEADRRAPGRRGLRLLLCAERTSGVRLRSRSASAAVRRCLERTADGLCHIRGRKIGRRSSSTSPGGVPVVRLASPAPTPWRSSKPWPPNAFARSPREGRLILEPRAREGDRPLVARQGAKQDRYLGSNLSVCVPAARASAISAARAADAWHGATGIGENPTWRKGRQHDGSRR